jgi:hypothetical protein
MAGFDLSLLLSLPMVFHSAWICFDGASHTLLAHAGHGGGGGRAGWLYSLAGPLTGGSEVFSPTGTPRTYGSEVS